jgi:hypothetical protein
MTVDREADLAEGSRLIREGNGTSFVLLRVNEAEPPSFKRDLNPSTCRSRFRLANAAG